MTSSQSRMMMVPGPSKMLRAQLRMTPAPSKANTTRSRMTAAPSKITVTQSKMVPVPSIIRIPVEQSKTMTVVPSSQSVRTEAEYLSTNNHRPFVDSQGAIGIDPCKDGNYCNEPSLASIASGTNKHKGKPIKKLRVSLAGQKRQEKNHKGHYQVHLKKDDDVQETIEYNIEFPNRVAVRMEYLMTSTKVRLNDRQFMDTLFEKLIEEEAKSVDKATKLRQVAERNRVKKLVIEGLMPPPNDMLELYHHPVFRVNAMLRRLDHHDKGLYNGPKIEENITPVEPFEYDGDEFFKHLHQHGTYWIPSEERAEEQEKLAGKIARAKVRLLEKRWKEADNDKLMRLLYAADHPNHASYIDEETNFEFDEEDKELKDDTPQVKDEKKKRRISKIKGKIQEEAEQRLARYKKRQEILEKRERLRKKRALERQKERDKVFLEDRENERMQIIAGFKHRMANKTLTDVRAVVSEEDDELADNDRVPLMNYKMIFQQPETPPDLSEDESLKRLRDFFNIKGGSMLTKFSPSTNPTVARYIDTIKNAKELFHFGSELSDLYNREQEKAEDFMIKLGRII